MAAYTCDLDKDQQIYIENQGSRTVIRLTSGGLGQQQSQSNSFETGNWRVPPTVFRTRGGVVLRIEAEQSQLFIQVQSNAMSKLDAAPSLSDADILPLQKVETETPSKQSSMPGMQPMQPMEPMKPMQPMQMGNMKQMGEPPQMESATEQRQSTKNFCPQCGSKVEKGDRFCSNCGNELAP